MGNKSVQKKQYIVEQAAKVFTANGFKRVTMKDVVEACDISRGGLYLYFSDTEELFEAAFALEKNAGLAFLKQNTKGMNPAQILLSYLGEKKKDILKKKENLDAATFEYLFEMRAKKKDNPVKKQHQEETKALEKVIADGVKQKWMICENPAATAKNMMITLDGLKATAHTYGVTSELVDQTIEYILGSVGLTMK